jgi:hypothetical protein
MSSSAKTLPTAASVPDFLAARAEGQRHADCQALQATMQAATGEAPVLWGTAIVGFGVYRFQYDSGRSGIWPLVAFSPRKGDMAVYVANDLLAQPVALPLLAKLGRHKAGAGCINIKKLADVDLAVLQDIINASVASLAAQRIPVETAT